MNPIVKTMNPMLRATIVMLGAKKSDAVIPTQKRIAAANEAHRSPDKTTNTAPQNAPADCRIRITLLEGQGRGEEEPVKVYQ
jgi:hypothetical protein